MSDPAPASGPRRPPRPETPAGPPLQSGGGGGTFDGMEARVGRLEVQVDGLRNDVRGLKADTESLKNDVQEIKSDLKAMLVTVSRLPTRADLVNYVIGALAVVVAICGIFIAGLGWLETRAARVQPAAVSAPQPIVIALPAAAPAATERAPPARTPR